MARPFTIQKTPDLSEQRGQTYPRLVELMQRLLAEDGCPWDRAQDLHSLRRYVLEEASEVVDAIGEGELDQVKAELGDLLMQIVFIGELARRQRAFGPDDVIASIIAKLVRRHPHVFADGQADDPASVRASWEQIKAAERAQSGQQTELLDRVPRSLPPLAGAQRMSDVAAAVGFDWQDMDGCRAKVDEELAELNEALASGTRERIEEELGDTIFALVNVARRAGVEADEALRCTNRKFRTRFAHVERRAQAEHGGLGSPGEPLPMEFLDAYWNEAKDRRDA